MPIQDAHQAGTDKVLDHMAANHLPPRTAPQGVDFDETVRVMLDFASNHYGILIGLAFAVIAVIAARRALRTTQFPRFTPGGKTAMQIIATVGIVALSSALLGPAGGAWVGGVIVVTAFTRWRYPRE